MASVFGTTTRNPPISSSRWSLSWPIRAWLQGRNKRYVADLYLDRYLNTNRERLLS